MRSSTIIYSLGAFAAMPLSLLVNAGPTLLPRLDSPPDQAYCCLPNCITCRTHDCYKEECNDILYAECCPEGHREVDKDGMLHIYNLNNEEMDFIDE
ncbi:hypothetical protein F5Y11DRAFT_349925 [Daldinia sp. FL1419]|nr:hypothetical protein F5Y11DRAFT_349925 [Daldinia sp. FL1419]